MIKLKNITVGYGKETVLTGVSASFERGKLICVVGRNGCGKSTLLKTMINILPVRTGEIVVDGKAIDELSRKETARIISYLAQGRTVPEMTVWQMLLHGRFPHLTYPRQYTDSDRAIAMSAARKMGLIPFLDKPMYALSGGLRQMAYIAMALTQDTDYILLDEPTTYLDIGNQIDLMKVLRELADSGKGIAAVMHDLPMAFDFSDEILVLNKGTSVCQRKPTELCGSLMEEIFGVSVKRSEDGKFFCQYS